MLAGVRDLTPRVGRCRSSDNGNCQNLREHVCSVPIRKRTMLKRLPRFIRALRGMYATNPDSDQTIAHQFEKHAAGPLAQRPFLLYRGHCFTYEAANRLVNRYASAYRSLGLRAGDTVALMMENRPEYLWHFLAAGKLGVTISLINPQ